MSDRMKESFLQSNNVHGVLGVELVEATPDKVVLQVPMGPKVAQPYGILHGGVSALLAESAASIGGALNVGPGQYVVGAELNCSHLRSMSSGVLTATATPIRKGRRVQVWGIDLTDQDGRQICVARCSVQVLDGPAPG
jgi:1,4-dihydroxy-2-naphthoyl-CoA hydrolase